MSTSLSLATRGRAVNQGKSFATAGVMYVYGLVDYVERFFKYVFSGRAVEELSSKVRSVVFSTVQRDVSFTIPAKASSISRDTKDTIFKARAMDKSFASTDKGRVFKNRDIEEAHSRDSKDTTFNKESKDTTFNSDDKGV